MFRKLSLFIAILSILGIVDTRFAHAQQIITDGDTATIVTKNGDRITIDGNTLSRDGKNLFHSFREFGLSQQQIATFLTNPNIQNILTRVTGGNPSYINGLIQVVGGNSNLFLMNPAGIVFGQGASINVPADFTATTATSIGFNNGILNAIGSNDYQNLTDNPRNFVFNNNQNGSIINAGDLKVAQGSNINLIGGNVINTGTIETPQGKINIQAVEGTSRIKITPEGSLLILEIDIPKDEQGNLLGFTPQDLPTLLTGANNAGINTPNITTNNVGVNGINPQIQVGNTNIPNETGIAIASGKISTSSQKLGGEITVLGDKVGVINGEIEANGATGGGKVLIGGDFQGKGTIPNSQITVVDKDSTIKANANISGEGGKVIIWGDKNTSFTGNIEAKGGINGGNGGFVEVSGKENLNFNGKVDTTAPKGNTGTLLLDPENVTIVNGSFAQDDSQIDDGEILAGDGLENDFSISELALESLSGTTNVLIEANNNITIENLTDNNLTFEPNLTTGVNPRTSVTFTADADSNGIGDFSMNSSDTIVARGRDVNISGQNIIVGSINTSRINATENGGNIILNSPNSTIVQGSINGNSLITDTNGITTLNGNITTIGDQTYNDEVVLNQNITLRTNNLTAKSIEVNQTSSNPISLTINANDSVSITGRVNNNEPLAISTARNNQGSGDITITAENDINITGAINTTASDVNSFVPNAGDVSIRSRNGDVFVFGIGTFGINTSGKVNVSGDNLNLGPIISFLDIDNLANSTGGIIDLQGNNLIVTGEIRGESLTTTGNLTLNNNPNIPSDIPFFGNSNITTTGNQTYNDDVILNTSTIFTTNNLTAKSIEVNQTSSNPISLTINANDSVSISGKANENQPLAISTARNNQASGDIIITAENDINFGGVVNTTATSGTSFATNAGNISITSNNGNVTIPAVAAFGTLSSGEVNISGKNLILGPILTFLTSTNVTSGNINLQGNNINVNGTIQGQFLTTSGNFSLSNNSAFLNSGNPSLSALGNANITTIGNQNYNNFIIQDNANLISTQGKINFSGNINTASNNLTVRSLNGVNFSDGGIISSASGNLLLQTTNPNGNIFIGSGNDTQFVITNLNQANGFNTITIGQNNSLGNITVNETLTVNDPLILQASNINVNQTINGNDNASITIKGAKTTTTLNADIITQGNDIIIDDNVILGDNVTLATNNRKGGNIDILGSINGNQNLTLNAGNSDILINDSIGNNQALNILSITANNTNFGGGLVSTTGNQNLNSNLILSKNTVFDTQGSFSAKNISSTNTNVNITAQQITTENIVTKGGDISLISNNSSVNTENLNTSATTGGAIAINSATIINTGNIETAGSTGNGGNVTLNAPNDIQVSSINTSSNNGRGGDVNISTFGRLRVTDTIPNTNISIDSSGRNGGGSISIDFFPDNSQANKTSDPRLPFTVGNSSNNGTKGIITNGEFSINPDQYFEVVQEGNINVNLLEPKPIIVNPKQKKIDLLKKDGDRNNAVEPPPETTPQIATILPPSLPIATITQAQEILTTIEREAAEKPAFIYVSFTPKGYQPRDLEEEFARREATNTQEYSQVDINKPNLQPSISFKPAQEDQLDLLIVTNKGKPIRVSVPVNRQQVVESATNLWSKVSDNFALNDDYKTNAAELYSWLIAPIESQLKEQEISNLLFILPAEIRFIPIAALYDTNSQQFLVEKYSSGLAPSLNLNDNRYRPIKDLSLLAMGASQFADTGVTPLPAVGVELPTIKKVWNDEPTEDYQRYLNGNFTLEEIKANLERKPYGIVHFGTHGEFNPTETSDSFIQLYNSRLPLNEIRTLGLNQPLVELMVLSACETAFGNEIAELGFAGLAVQAGVKTAMGSVWQVSDTGTLALMTDFYSQLKQQTTKAEALRQTQLDMLTGKIYKTDDGSKIITPKSEVSLEGLPETSRQKEDFTHPFYWAPFTMIGNPW